MASRHTLLSKSAGVGMASTLSIGYRAWVGGGFPALALDLFGDTSGPHVDGLLLIGIAWAGFVACGVYGIRKGWPRLALRHTRRFQWGGNQLCRVLAWSPRRAK